MPHRFVILVASLLLISASEPPDTVPVPQQKPASEKTEENKPAGVPAEAETPKPQPNPENNKQEENKPEGDKATTAPSTEEEDKSDDNKRDTEEKQEGVIPVEQEDPAELQACITELKTLGAEFKTLDTIKGAENGCGIASPIELSSVGQGIKLNPAGPMRCETALALSRWAKDMLVPSARLSMPERKITALANASTYVCRNRNSTKNGKISEHAKGNAVDISSIAFDKGDPLIMKPRDEDGSVEGAFQRTITTAACLFFKTVLSPGSDATHQDHLHLDVLERKGGYLYCR
ncbi:extensin family protein [Agrobacterium sp.]|uniref:extensin-like domain-containing protein n=1 Tax=Agrobacterium sp. TaxID=361 RepID=UPI0028AB653B|nr:extensin family protein [Agrobacterium sp.]